MDVWVKVGDSQETIIHCNTNDVIDKLKENIKNKLSPKFDSVPTDDIIIRDKNNNIQRAGDKLSTLPWGDSEDNCFLVDAPPAPVAQGKITILFKFYCYSFYTFPILNPLYILSLTLSILNQLFIYSY
jgi:hypothetical protein